MCLAIVGISHVGVLKLALPDVMARYPVCIVSSLPYPVMRLAGARMRGQIFRAHPRSDAEAPRIIDVNDDLALDVADADLIMDSITQIADQFGQDTVSSSAPRPIPRCAPGPKQENRMTRIQRHPTRDVHIDGEHLAAKSPASGRFYRALTPVYCLRLK